MTHFRKQPACRMGRARRGVALLECSLVLPLLAFFLVALLLMGWGMQNRQQTELAARLRGWAATRGTAPPDRYGGTWALVVRDGLLGQRNDEEREIDPDYVVSSYMHNSEGIQLDTMRTLEEWVQRVTIEHEDAGGAADLWMLSTDHWPWGAGARYEIMFPIPWSYWEHLDWRPVETRFIRDGVEWRYTQIHNEQVITEEFLYDVEDALESVDAPGDALAAQFRWMYRAEW